MRLRALLRPAFLLKKKDNLLKIPTIASSLILTV